MYAKYSILAVGMCLSFNLVAGEIAGNEPINKNNNEDDGRVTFSDNFLTLGTEDGQYGGKNFIKFDRDQIVHQIKTFIPPLLRPAVTQHAYVLPPNAISISNTQRYMTIEGDDFFKNGKSNTNTFGDFEVNRQLTDLDVFYGFDLDEKYLHGFTLRVNIPYFATQTNGAVHPNGQQYISLENGGGSTELGDIALYIKKKLTDQGTSKFGVAVVAAVFLPTGKNDVKFGSNGRIAAQRPNPGTLVDPSAANDDAAFAKAFADGFDSMQKYLVDNGYWQNGKCFFSNYNANDVATGDGECNGNPHFTAPGGVQNFSYNDGNSLTTDFPFNKGVFGRFAADGRMPSTLQPGVGETSYLLGIFGTRQFGSSSLVGRSALHLGLIHRFLPEVDDIDFGDTTTIFASFVKPIYKDYLAMDLSFIGFNHQNDSYAGSIPEPEIHECTAAEVSTLPTCNAEGDEIFQFSLHERSAFSGGFTGFLTPSLIFSPDPQIRASISALIRVIKPDLGPAPKNVLRASLEYTF